MFSNANSFKAKIKNISKVAHYLVACDIWPCTVKILPHSSYPDSLYKANSWRHLRRVHHFLDRERGILENFFQESKVVFFGDKIEISTIKRFLHLCRMIAGKRVSIARWNILKLSSLYTYPINKNCQINLRFYSPI